MILLKVGTNKPRIVRNIKKESYWRKLIDGDKVVGSTYQKVK